MREIGLAGLNGYIMIRRHKAKSLQMKDWLSNADPLCHVEVLSRGSIEDAGSMALQADFAARHLGGGVLRTGRVQVINNTVVSSNFVPFRFRKKFVFASILNCSCPFCS